MTQESGHNTTHTKDMVLTLNPIWKILADCEITLIMDKLLGLVPRFQHAVENWMWGIDGLEISANYTESSTGPTVVDHHNPAIKVVL